MKKVFLHVGLPKTGSTFLQQNVFPYMNINLIRNNMNASFGSLTNFSVVCKLLDDLPNVITDENLYGNVFGLNNSVDGIDVYDNNFNIAIRLQRLYPNAKIIVVFRELDSWIKSLHKQLKGNPYTKQTFNFRISSEYKMFEQYEKCLKNMFYKVLVLHYEDLKNNQDNFIQNICDFINVDFPENYDRRKVMVSLNEKQLRCLSVIPKLPIPKKVGYDMTTYVRGMFRRWNR